MEFGGNQGRFCVDMTMIAHFYLWMNGLSNIDHCKYLVVVITVESDRS